MSTVARGLAELVHQIRPESLPADVVAETKRRVLDAVGVSLAGFDTDIRRIAHGLAEDLGGKEESTVWGAPKRVSCDKATLVNSTMLRYLDYMDSHAGKDACHPCFNIPPCLAVAERVGASGKQLLAAIVAGYEIQIRFQDNCVVGKRGWFSGMYLEFSVPLATGLLLGLDVEQLTNAVAISASHGNTLAAQSAGHIPQSKSTADGMVSMTGVVSALLAKRGITGPHDVVESKAGFERAIAESLDRDGLLKPIGEFKVMEVNTKWFNTVRIAQTAVTGVFGIMDKLGITWRDVESLDICLPTGEFNSHDGVWNSASRLRPTTRDSANHSPIYSVSVAMVDRVLGPEQYEPAKLANPDVHSVIDRVKLKPDGNLDKHWPAAAVTRVVLKTKDGRSGDVTTLYPPGHHKNRVSQEQLQEKFTRLAGHKLDAGRRKAFFEAVAHLDSLKSVDELTSILRA
jgi:2-methylcitrate dehydratase